MGRLNPASRCWLYLQALTLFFCIAASASPYPGGTDSGYSQIDETASTLAVLENYPKQEQSVLSPVFNQSTDHLYPGQSAPLIAVDADKFDDQQSEAGDWRLSGFRTHHFENNGRLNDQNTGGFFEHDFDQTWGALVGAYDDSQRHESIVIGVRWVAVHFGPLSVGLVPSFINGYPDIMRGNFFPAVIPFASAEIDKVRINLVCIPPLGVTPLCSLQFGVKEPPR